MSAPGAARSSGPAAEVLEAYPELEEEDVRKAMQYAAWLASDQLHHVESA
jgi:uncharacterized protein (DUF433 family)